MFCPQCGQQQPSDEVRFCPRCGLSLLPHAVLLAAVNNTASDNATTGLSGAQLPAPAKKRVGKRRAAKLIFFSVVLFPIFLAFSLMVDTGEPLLVPFAMFLTGLAWWAYVRLFGDELPAAPRAGSRRDLKSGANRPALGAQQFVPASSFDRQRADTAEMARPPSVTEHTTTLLDKDV